MWTVRHMRLVHVVFAKGIAKYNHEKWANLANLYLAGGVKSEAIDREKHTAVGSQSLGEMTEVQRFST